MENGEKSLKEKRIVRVMRRAALYGLIFLPLCLLAGWLIYRHIGGYSAQVYGNAEQLPAGFDTALVLGTSPTVKGLENLFFRYRMDAAARLYRTGRIRRIILSGANPTVSYNEPELMRLALRKQGVPDTAMELDYAGFRTLDSVVRARNVFGVTKFICVSQRFHCERALYLAKHHGLEAVGYAASDVPLRWRLKTGIREFFARTAAVLDIVLNRQPHFPV